MVDIRLNPLPCFRTLDGCQQANMPTRILAITQTPALLPSSSTYHLKADFSEGATVLSVAFSVTVNC